MERLQEVSSENGIVQDIYVHMLTESGTTVETLLPCILSELDKASYDLLIVAIGINNLSNKNSNGTITPIFQEVANLVDVMTLKYQKLKSDVSAHPNAPPLVIAQMVGVKFHRYNEAHGRPVGGIPLLLNPYPLQQMVVNEAMK